MNPLDRQTYTPAPKPEAAPPLWAQAAGLILAAAGLYLAEEI